MSPTDTARRTESGESSSGGHRAAKRALELIEHVAASDDPVSLSELARQLDLPKSSAHALARTLADEGYLLRDDRGAYALGPRLLSLIGRLPHRLELPRVARPFMEELVETFGETAILGIRQGDHVVYIEQVEAPQMIRYVAPLGEGRPLHATSIGKVILAAMSPDEADRVLRGVKLERFTEHTLTGLRALRGELASVREQGYAVNREESMEGIAAIAVPIHEGGDEQGRVIAGLSMTGPAARMSTSDLTAALPRLTAAAARIGAAVQRR